MIKTLAIAGYRSLRELVVPLGQLNLVTGANGSGKSSLYRALRLLSDAASNAVVSSLAREGGLKSTIWAGPETVARSVKQGQHPVEGTARNKPISLQLGFSGDSYGYSIELGLPPPPATAFAFDPAIKRECLWHGPVYRRSAALVDRRGNLVSLATGSDAEPEFLTQALGPNDSMLASIADPLRAPEMLTVRETIRAWRFYDAFRTDVTSPVRTPQIGTFTPVLNNDGTDLAAALQTILEIGDEATLASTISDAFPGSRLVIDFDSARFDVHLWQHGLLRPLTSAEFSDGTLRFLLLTAALLTPRPPALMILNEPETSLHPDLLPALGRLIFAAAQKTQMIVVSHAERLISALEESRGCQRIHLHKSFGETSLQQQDVFSTPKWQWPAR